MTPPLTPPFPGGPPFVVESRNSTERLLHEDRIINHGGGLHLLPPTNMTVQKTTGSMVAQTTNHSHQHDGGVHSKHIAPAAPSCTAEASALMSCTARPGGDGCAEAFLKMRECNRGIGVFQIGRMLIVVVCNSSSSVEVLVFQIGTEVAGSTGLNRERACLPARTGFFLPARTESFCPPEQSLFARPNR